MKLSNPILFLIPAVIWGSTFYVIKFQVGVVPPIWSVSYRFILAGILLLGFCRLRGIQLTFSRLIHLRFLLLGILLFGVNYWLVYIAELKLTSALVAVAFSTIMFFNILFGRLFLGRTAERKTFFGAFLGIIGTAVIFYEDLNLLNADDLPINSLIFCFSSVVVASLGNITSAANQSLGIPVIQANAFGMLYGGLFLGMIGLVTGAELIILNTPEYLGSLFFLAIFGSIIAFGAYLTLIGNIGADRAAYALIVIPVIAVSLSSFFEGLTISIWIGMGVVLILIGNYIVLKK